MKRRHISFLVLLLLSLIACLDEGYQVEGIDEVPQDFNGVAWVQTFGGSGDDTPRAIIKTQDGGFAVFGFTNSTDDNLATKSLAVNDYWLLKFSSSGTLEWQKTYGGSGDDRGQAVIQTADGGYAITGYAQSDDGDASNNEGFHDNWVLRLDAAGTILWEKSFGFSGHDHSYDLVETADNGLFFSGFLDVTSSNGEGATNKNLSLSAHGVGEFWGTKVDAQGNLNWRKFFGGTNNDRAYSLVHGHGGGYVMAGFTESNDFDISASKGSYDFWVVKVDKLGNLVWESSLGGSGIDQGQDIIATADESYIVVGNTFSNDIQVSKNNGQSDVWMVKIDNQGAVVWEQSFGGSAFDDVHSIKATPDGGYLLVGNSKSNDGDLNQNFGENDFWLLKTDANGTLEWQQNFGGSGLDFAFDAIAINNDEFIIVGETASIDFPGVVNKGGQDLVILKVAAPIAQ